MRHFQNIVEVPIMIGISVKRGYWNENRPSAGYRDDTSAKE